MELITVRIQKPDAVGFVLGQTRSAKTLEDLHERLLDVALHLEFGAAFCEASGDRLVRCAGNNDSMLELAKSNATAIGAGNIFILFLGENSNLGEVLSVVRALPDVTAIHCATSNPTEIMLGASDQGCGVIGVIDGFGPKGVEPQNQTTWRRDYLMHAAGFRM